MTQSRYTFDVATDRQTIERLKDDWDSLYRKQAAPHLSDSFDWAALSWDMVTSQRRRHPYCAILRRDGRLVALLPLVTTPGGLAKVASPMNSEASEYCPCLLDPDEPPADLWASLHAGLKDRRDIDALRLPHVRQDAPLDDLIRGWPGSQATVVQHAPFVRASDFPTLEDYTAWLPKKIRSKLRRWGRGLEETGRVEFEEVTSAQARIEVLQWLLKGKDRWLRRRGLKNERLMSTANSEFLEATLLQPWTMGSRAVFALKLDGAVIAAEVTSIDSNRVESFIIGFDDTHSSYAPGHLLTLQIIGWAIDRHLDFDFRTGSESYKLIWTNHDVLVTSYLLPLTSRGQWYVGYRMARRWLSTKAPKGLRARLSALLGRSGSAK